jgi:hypothetical protein
MLDSPVSLWSQVMHLTATFHFPIITQEGPRPMLLCGIYLIMSNMTFSSSYISFFVLTED